MTGPWSLVPGPFLGEGILLVYGLRSFPGEGKVPCPGPGQEGIGKRGYSHHISGLKYVLLISGQLCLDELIHHGGIKFNSDCLANGLMMVVWEKSFWVVLWTTIPTKRKKNNL